MQIKHQKLTLLYSKKHEALRKNGETFTFLTNKFQDDNANTFYIKFSKELQEDKAFINRLQDFEGSPVFVDMLLYPKSKSRFEISAMITNLSLTTEKKGV